MPQIGEVMPDGFDPTKIPAGAEETVPKIGEVMPDGFDPTKVLAPKKVDNTKPNRPKRNLLEKGASALKGVGSQYSYGAQKTQEDVNRTMGEIGNVLGPSKTTLDPSTSFPEPQNIPEKAARIMGEYLAPVPEFDMVPGLGAAFNEAAKAAGSVAKSTQSFQTMAKFLGKAATDLSVKSKDGLATLMSKLAGTNKESADRLLTKGNSIWKREYLNDKTISKMNLDKATTSIKNGFDAVGKEREKQVMPLLTDEPSGLGTTDIFSNFKKAVEETRLAKIVNGKFVKGSDFTKISEEKNTMAALNAMKNAVSEMGAKDLSLKELHTLRQRVANIIENSDIKDEMPQLYDAYRSSVRNFIDEKMPQAYKDVNAKFSKLYDLRDEMKLGKKLGNTNVESTLLGIQGKAKTYQLEALKELDSFLPERERFVEPLLDELAVKDYAHFTPRHLHQAALAGGTLLGSSIIHHPYVGAAIAAGTSPRVQSVLARGGVSGASAAQKAVQELAKLPPSIKARLGLDFIPEKYKGEEQ